MLKALIISLFISVASIAQVSHTFTLVDSAATTDSVLIPYGYFPTTLYVGDLNKISEFEFDYKIGSVWYTLSVPDSNYAVKVSDNVIKSLPRDLFENIKPRAKEDIYFRLNPNDSDTTSRNIYIRFDTK